MGKKAQQQGRGAPGFEQPSVLVAAGSALCLQGTASKVAMPRQQLE